MKQQTRKIPWRILCTLLGLLLVSQFSLAASEPKPSSADRALAERILADTRLDRVNEMGRELLKSGLNAGSGYSEVWIRDLNTFIVPALDVVPQEVIRGSLLVFFEFQGEDGNIIDGYVPVEKANVAYEYQSADGRPELRAHKNTVETDQESSLVQAVSRYIRKTGDDSILDEVIRGLPVRTRLEQALKFPLNHRFSEEYGLVWGATTADWGDVQPEHEWGVDLDENTHRAIDIYDNALLIVAIREYLDVATEVGSDEFRDWSARRDRLRAAVRRHLWDDEAQKFKAHLYLEGSPFDPSFPEERVFYHGGTAVAIEAGLLSRDEILVSYGQMLANMRVSGAATLGLTLFPVYPEGSFLNPGMGPYSYQNGGDWTWFGARMVRQLARNGFVAESYRELGPMLDRVIKHQGFHEWWSISNEPRGSGLFRGSAGVLLEAIEELRRWAADTQSVSD